MRTLIGAIIGLAVTLTACVQTSEHGRVETPTCGANEPIGQFNPPTDVFFAHFDIKTDTDDLHSAAAVATLLAHPRFKCVDYFAVSGTYGVQVGDYVDPGPLFADAFGERWLDAHTSRTAAIETLGRKAADIIGAGGHVWIMEGGQSDVSAGALRHALSLAPDLPAKTHFHVVQHSDWNEQVTSPGALAFLKAQADYIKIKDGNAVGNGTPGFNTPSGEAWPALLGHPETGAMWQQARTLGLAANGTGSTDETIATGGYNNPSIGAGGLDFSDAAEAAWIFCYEDLADVDAFVATFAATTDQP